MRLREEFFRGLDLFADTVDRIGDRTILPSACAEWDLSGVVAHQRDALLAGLLPNVGAKGGAGNLAGTADARTVADQWAVVDLQVRTVMEEAAFDDDNPHVREAAVGLFLHAWDISWGLAAAGHGDRVEFDPASVAWLEDVLRSTPEEQLRAPNRFGPEQQAPEGASDTERLMAFAGRTV